MDLKALVSNQLSMRRYEHTIRVAETAVSLARLYGVDENKAYRAGLLHDYAKEFPTEQLLKIAIEGKWPLTELEKRNPYLLHGPVAAIYLSQEKIETDPDVLAAITWHTTGRASMSKLEKIIYVADMIEPGRKGHEIKRLQLYAHQGLDLITFMCVQYGLAQLIENKRAIHSKSIELYNSLVEEH